MPKRMNAVRDTLNTVRYDWFGVRVGGRGASMRGLWPVAIFASLLVFGSFFAIGRVTAGKAPPVESSSAVHVERAAIPDALHGSSPIAGDVPSAIATPPAPAHAPARVEGTEAPSTIAASQASAGKAPSTVAPTVTAKPESAPAQAPVPAQTAAPSHAGGGSGSAGHGASGGGSAGGGGGKSFDSSE